MRKYPPVKIVRGGCLTFDARGSLSITHWGFDLMGRPPVPNPEQVYARDIAEAVAAYTAEALKQMIARYPAVKAQPPSVEPNQ